MKPQTKPQLEKRRDGKKPGPKPIEDGSRLDCLIRVRVTPSQHKILMDELEPMKQMNNATIGDLVRLKLFTATNNKRQPRLKKAERSTTHTTFSNTEIMELTVAISGVSRSLDRIGININQVVKKINTLEKPGIFRKELEKFLKELADIQLLKEELIKFMGQFNELFHF